MVLDEFPHPVEVTHTLAYPKIVIELASCRRPAVLMIPLACMEPDNPSIMLYFLIDDLEQILKGTVDTGGFLERVYFIAGGRILESVGRRMAHIVVQPVYLILLEDLAQPRQKIGPPTHASRRAMGVAIIDLN
jgi:hypothetical protein